MTNKLLSYGGLILQVLTFALVGFMIFSQGNLGAWNTTNFSQLDTEDGYSVDGTSIINGSGSFVGAINGTQFQLDSGTTIGEFNCATSTWNPGSIATSTLDGGAVTSTDIALSGSAMGDLCLASLTSATTISADVTCDITGTATSTINLYNIGASALDLATGTARVCYFGF